MCRPLPASGVLSDGGYERCRPAEGRIDCDLRRLFTANQLQDRGIVSTRGERLDRCPPLTPREETKRRLFCLGGKVDAKRAHSFGHNADANRSSSRMTGEGEYRDVLSYECAAGESGGMAVASAQRAAATATNSPSRLGADDPERST